MEKGDIRNYLNNYIINIDDTAKNIFIELKKSYGIKRYIVVFKIDYHLDLRKKIFQLLGIKFANRAMELTLSYIDNTYVLFHNVMYVCGDSFCIQKGIHSVKEELVLDLIILLIKWNYPYNKTTYQNYETILAFNVIRKVEYYDKQGLITDF